MPFHRTDEGRIEYPQGISASDRRLSRRFYDSFILLSFVNETLPKVNIVIACSGGLDSTVLAHVCSQSRTIRPHRDGRPVALHLAYVNHQLRGDAEINEDISHVLELGSKLGFDSSDVLTVSVPEEGNVQAQAREARYNALAEYAESKESHTVLVAHHANDVAETKLWQFLTGRPVSGIARMSTRASARGWMVDIRRPLIDFTREQLEDYARIWGLRWREDSSNNTDKYARNRIRRELIPWVQKEINPGIVKMLCKS